MNAENYYVALIYGICMLAIGLTQYFIPVLSRRGTLLGVDLKVEDQKRPEIVAIVKNYKTQILVATLISVITAVYIGLFHTEKWIFATILIIVWLVIFYGIYYRTHNKIKAFKKEHQLYIEERRRAINLKMTAKPLEVKGFSLKAYVIPLLVIILNIVLAVVMYDKVPQQMPIHWGFDGKVTDYAEKSWFTVLLPSIFNIFMLGINFFVHYTLLRMQKRLDPEHPDEALYRLIISRRYWSIYVFVLTMMLVLVMTVLNLMTLGLVGNYWANVITIGTIIITIFAVVFAIYIGIKVGNQGSRLKLNDMPLEDAFEDDDEYWILGGTIYYNPDDPAVFIPKRVGIGSSVNVGIWQGKLLIALLFILVIGSILFAVKMQ